LSELLFASALPPHERVTSSFDARHAAVDDERARQPDEIDRIARRHVRRAQFDDFSFVHTTRDRQFERDDIAFFVVDACFCPHDERVVSTVIQHGQSSHSARGNTRNNARIAPRHARSRDAREAFLMREVMVVHRFGYGNA
jgi:5-deoxy-D-glucuronate isomerase